MHVVVFLCTQLVLNGMRGVRRNPGKRNRERRSSIIHQQKKWSNKESIILEGRFHWPELVHVSRRRGKIDGGGGGRERGDVHGIPYLEFKLRLFFNSVPRDGEMKLIKSIVKCWCFYVYGRRAAWRDSLAWLLRVQFALFRSAAVVRERCSGGPRQRRITYLDIVGMLWRLADIQPYE